MSMSATVKFTSFDYNRADHIDFKLPKNSCDSHHHIFDHRFPYAQDDTRNLPEATFKDYQAFKRELGFTRHIIVQPSSYGTDNSCLLEALKQGGQYCRGEAVIDEQNSPQNLTALFEHGVVGIRFNFCAGKRPDIQSLSALTAKAADYGWHIQLHLKPELLPGLYPILNRISNHIVFDHYAGVTQPLGERHEAWPYLLRLLEQGRCWVKLSGLYHVSQQADFSDMEHITKQLVRIAPERLLWGSDWPHPSLTTAKRAMPDDKYILTKLYQWLETDENRQKVFVDNPYELFFK